MAAWGYEFYLRVLKVSLTRSLRSLVSSLRSMAVLSSGAQERRSREIRDEIAEKTCPGKGFF